MLSLREVAQSIDHTLLRSDSTEKQVLQLCQEARDFGFKAVCVLPCYVTLAVKSLKESGITVATVIGFPLGAHLPEVKAYEAKLAFSQGADEVDMVINIGALKEKKMSYVYDDISAVVSEARAYPGKVVKVIIETALLSREEKLLACQAAVEAGADFVKTSTGFGGGGATVEDVQLMAEAVRGKAKVKASGGIRTWEQAQALMNAGAQRLGTSSGPAILQSQLTKQ
ncbi:MAG: deoxyribose-phosphate aldolase [Bacillota bacterium]|uniref:Deoxyribose-phosphate aldolase n=1 Tax=Thermanaerosceptrum fracticalcis TaxID=1712410 RepID=A0A7G6E221_THEFR|nr:deoxyribose-phosphate aldolase [Thermanaerosceptrum fracticalcis]QNB46125.1 deoxyribose-phosphate aldolase [Thermanaerosceptrum fracticalcis]